MVSSFSEYITLVTSSLSIKIANDDSDKDKGTVGRGNLSYYKVLVQ